MRAQAHSCRALFNRVVCIMPVPCQNIWMLTRTRARRSRVDASDCLDLLLPQSISVFAFDFSGSCPAPTNTLLLAIAPRCPANSQRHVVAISPTRNSSHMCMRCMQQPHMHSHKPMHHASAPILQTLPDMGMVAWRGSAHVFVLCMQQLHTHPPRTHSSATHTRMRLERWVRKAGENVIKLRREGMQGLVSRTAKRFRWAFTSKMISWLSSTTLGPGGPFGRGWREGRRE